MTRFYDPKDSAELTRIEALLRRGGVEYTVRRTGEEGAPFCEIHVAEEDVPFAEELLQ
jgi:hypothetical protein